MHAGLSPPLNADASPPQRLSLSPPPVTPTSPLLTAAPLIILALPPSASGSRAGGEDATQLGCGTGLRGDSRYVGSRRPTEYRDSRALLGWGARCERWWTLMRAEQRFSAGVFSRPGSVAAALFVASAHEMSLLCQWHTSKNITQPAGCTGRV